MQSDEAIGPFDALLQVHDLDTALAQLLHRKEALPEREQLAASEAHLAQLQAKAANTGPRRDNLLARQAELERRIHEVTDRRSRLETQMYEAKGSASRDLQAIDGEVHHLADRQRSLEDTELDIMEELEPLEQEWSAIERDRVSVDATIAQTRQALESVESELSREEHELMEQRREATSLLPTDLAERYERIRVRVGVSGAARLIGDRCNGCHLTIPSAEVDRIRHGRPDEIFACEQCGRILIRPKAGETA